MAQGVAVGDALPQFPIVPVLHALESEGAENLGGGQSAASGAGVLEASLEVLAHPLHEFRVVLDQVRDRLQDGIEAYTLAAERQVGEAHLGGGSLVSFSGLRCFRKQYTAIGYFGQQNRGSAMIEGEAPWKGGQSSSPT